MIIVIDLGEIMQNCRLVVGTCGKEICQLFGVHTCATAQSVIEDWRLYS